MFTKMYSMGFAAILAVTLTPALAAIFIRGKIRARASRLSGHLRDLEGLASAVRDLTSGRHFKVATVQERYHVIDRHKEPALARCQRDGIPFIAYFQLATGALAAADSILRPIAYELEIAPGQGAL